MHGAPAIAQYISAILFLAYGLNCFVSDKMIAEFERYRLPQLRVLTGVLQIAGGVGLIVGHWSWPILFLSSGGLMVMMFLAVLTRYKIRDSIVNATPATLLTLLNLYIFVAAVRSR